MTVHPKSGKCCRAALLLSVALSAACAQLPATDGTPVLVEGAGSAVSGALDAQHAASHAAARASAGPVVSSDAAGGFPPALATSGLPSSGWQIIDTRRDVKLSEKDFLRLVYATELLLLGEQHDQPLHHQLRARWLRVWADGPGTGVPARVPHSAADRGGALRHAGPSATPPARMADAPAPASPSGIADRGGEGTGAGQPPLIVFEHLDREHDPALQSAQRWRPEGPAGTWLQAARFDGKAWGETLYRPLFDAAFEASRERGARWVAANFSRESARAWMRAQMQGQGAAAGIDPALLRLKDQARWDDEAEQAVLAAMRDGHCNALPEEALRPMLMMQRARDAALALPLLQAGGRALLLAGNGHVDRRVGVPRYLPAGAGQVLVIGLENLPGEPAVKDPTKEAERDRHGGRAPINTSPGAADERDVPDATDATGSAGATGRTAATGATDAPKAPGEQGRRGAGDRAHRLSPPQEGPLSRLVGENRAARLRAAYDIVVLTPPSAEEKDHCAAFRARHAPASGGHAGSKAVPK